MRISLIARWASGNSQKPEGAEVTKDWRGTLLHLPLSEVDDQIGWSIPWLEGMLTHPRHDGYWNRTELTDEIVDLKLPMQHIVGYYDFFSRESVNNFMRMQQQARDPETRQQQQLILGPWDHGSIGRAKVGEVDFGEHAVIDAAGENLKWFERVLKDGDSCCKTSRRTCEVFFNGRQSLAGSYDLAAARFYRNILLSAFRRPCEYGGRRWHA